MAIQTKREFHHYTTYLISLYLRSGVEALESILDICTQNAIMDVANDLECGHSVRDIVDAIGRVQPIKIGVNTHA